MCENHRWVFRRIARYRTPALLQDCRGCRRLDHRTAGKSFGMLGSFGHGASPKYRCRSLQFPQGTKSARENEPHSPFRLKQFLPSPRLGNDIVALDFELQHDSQQLIVLGYRDRKRLEGAGLVSGRHCPGPGTGTIFITIDDETGNANLVVWAKSSKKFSASSGEPTRSASRDSASVWWAIQKNRAIGIPRPF